MSGRVTLDTFYQSKPWVRLVAMLRIQRINEHGDIICAHCGEPIVRAYDCIGHHVIELTEENVNDADIALNPDNIQLVHHKCHNRIHHKLEYANKAIYLVYGSPLSGKSTWVDSVKCPGDLIIDMDAIWQCVSHCDMYTKPYQLNSVVFGVRDYLIDCIKYRRGRWQRAYIIGGYPLISERQRLCNMLGATEVFIDTDRDTCINRLNQCQDGRDVQTWTNYIDDWWNKYTPLTLVE